MTNVTAPGWWRRNRWPLVALAILVPGTLALTTSSEWIDYQNNIFSRPITVQPSATGSYDDATFRLIDSVMVRGGTPEAEELDLDPGLDLVASVVEVTPGARPVDSCTLTVGGTSPEHPEPRTWSANINLPVGFPEIDGTEQYCFASEEKSFRLRVVATVPAGALDTSAWVVVEVFGQSPDYLVLELPGSAG